MIRLTLILACFLAAHVTCTQADDWPVWQHDNRRTGVSTSDVDITQLVPVWEWRSPAPPITAWHGPARWDAYAYHRNLPSMRSYDNAFHVIAVGDAIWFGSSVDDTLYCLDAASGQPRWTFTAEAPVRLAPTWNDGRVYFGSDDGYARCVDAASGALLWQSKPGPTERRILNNGRFIDSQPCRTGVVVADGKAWFASAMLPWQDAWLSCVDARSGRMTSAAHYAKKLPGQTMEGAPALSRDFLILPQGRVAPRLFDRATGDPAGQMVKSGGGSVVVVSLDEQIIHGPATDSRKGGFRRSSSESREVIAGLGRGNALVVAGTTSWMLTDTHLVCSDMTTGKVQWKQSTDCPCSLIKVGSTLVAGGIDQLRAYSASDGKPIWQAPANGRVFSLAVAGDRLFASTDTGVIHGFAKGTPAQVGQLRRTGAAATRIEASPVQQLQPPSDERLIGHWAFQQSTTSDLTVTATTGPDARLSAPPVFSTIGDHQALELDGKEQTVMLAPEFQSATLPEQNLAAAAWVRVDQPQEWGGIVGVVQDDGSVERGWLLGYRKDRFSFAVATTKGSDRLNYVTSQTPFETGRWYHVAATYDGKSASLYINGRLSGRSQLSEGPIRYPERAWYEIGAYHDRDEYFRMRGAIQEVSVYDTDLSPATMKRLYDAAATRFPDARPTANPGFGPMLTFTSPGTARICWTTDTPQASYLKLRGGGRQRTLTADELTTDHCVTIEDLRHNRMYNFQLGIQQDGQLLWTDDLECDTFFNFSPAGVVDGRARSGARLLKYLDSVPDRRGLCLLCGDFAADEVQQLVEATEFRVVVASSDAAHVKQLRLALRNAGLYGHRAAVTFVDNMAELPVVGAWANLIVATPDSDREWTELRRILRPAGGVLVCLDDQGQVESTEHRESLPGAADWTHLYATPDNAAFAGEQLGGAKRSEELNVQWVGRPGPRYQADRSGRKPSPLVADGRMFLQGLDRIVALDVFNGTVLWSQELTGFGRFNVPRDSGNWCATADAVFLVVGDHCWKLSAVTGEVLSRFPVTTQPIAGQAWGYVAAVGESLFGSELPEGTSWDDFWGDASAGWYDARSGEVTYPICSDRLFSRNAVTGELNWEYQRGVVLNSTITVADGTMYFVESRSESVLQSKTRRVGDPDLWNSLYLVAIDAATGSPKWEKAVDAKGPQVVCYLAHAQGQLTMVMSAEAKFQIASYSQEDGATRWEATAPWAGGKGDHGKAMMRPAISGDRIYLRPHVLSLSDGTVRQEKMPDGHGCGTYACTQDSVLYRAKTVTMWSPDDREVSTWERLRPDCWLSTIPACGMLLSPEGGGGCSCGSWMETSIGFLPAVFDPAAGADVRPNGADARPEAAGR